MYTVELLQTRSRLDRKLRTVQRSTRGLRTNVFRAEAGDILQSKTVFWQLDVPFHTVTGGATGFVPYSELDGPPASATD